MKYHGMHADYKSGCYRCDHCNSEVQKLKYVYELPGICLCRCSSCGSYISVKGSIEYGRKEDD